MPYLKHLPSFFTIVSACALAVSLTSCGGTDNDTLKGERLSVLQLEEKLQADITLTNTPILLPEPVHNKAWPMAGGYPDHDMQHLALATPVTEELDKIWRTNIGKGDIVLAPPVVYGNDVAAVDATGKVSLLSLEDGDVRWTYKTRSDVPGASLAFADSSILVATGDGRLQSLTLADGELQWQVSLPAPPRGEITVAGGRAYIRLANGTIEVRRFGDGSLVWQQREAGTVTSLARAASVAVSKDLVVVPQNDGQLVAFHARDGHRLWTANLTGRQSVAYGIAASLVGIAGHPVIDKGVVFAVAQGGRLLAIDGRSGRRLWEISLGSYNTPWIVGDNIYVLSEQHDLTALTRDGRIRWTQRLKQYDDPDDRSGPVLWYGPILAGGRLWLAGDDEELISLSPDTGQVLTRQGLPDSAAAAPVVADKTLLIMTTDGELVAYR